MLSWCAFTNTVGCKPMSSGMVSACIPHLPTETSMATIRGSWRPQMEPKSRLSKGAPALQFSFTSTPLLSGDYGTLSHTIPSLPKKQLRKGFCPQASKDVPFGFKYPAMTKKPRWWWRILASVSYLLPVHETWMHTPMAMYLHPFFQSLEEMSRPFLESLGLLPRWFLIAYFFSAYLGIVRRKEWPHFLRFHVAMGMLLEITLQVIGISSRWLPVGFLKGRVGVHLITALAIAFLFTVLEVIRCAITGIYADVPFLCEAAYFQIPFE
nr:chloroplast protein import component Tic20-I [Passiflora contracta]